MSVRYLDLANSVAIAAEVTGSDTDTVVKVAKLDLADCPSSRFTADLSERLSGPGSTAITTRSHTSRRVTGK